MTRERVVHGVPAVRDHEHIAAEVEQPRELVAAADRFLRPRPRHRGEIAGDQADGEKREQRDPVLRDRRW